MPEQIIWSTAPLADAISRATSRGQLQWRLRGFTTNDKHRWNGQVSSRKPEHDDQNSLTLRSQRTPRRASKLKSTTPSADGRGSPSATTTISKTDGHRRGKATTSTWRRRPRRLHSARRVASTTGNTWAICGITSPRERGWTGIGKPRNGI